MAASITVKNNEDNSLVYFDKIFEIISNSKKKVTSKLCKLVGLHCLKKFLKNLLEDTLTSFRGRSRTGAASRWNTL